MSVASHDANMAAMLAPKQRHNAAMQKPIPRIEVASAKVAGIEECKADK